MPEQMYSVEATCALLGGICRDTLWNLRKRGHIKCIRVGNRPMFLASQIEAYQRRQLNGGRVPDEPAQDGAQDGASEAIN